jgi:hypothetical protein
MGHNAWFRLIQYVFSLVVDDNAGSSDWVKKLTYILADFAPVNIDCANQLHPRSGQQNLDDSESDWTQSVLSYLNWLQLRSASSKYPT